MKTSTFCIKCNVHLCLLEERNCFLDFHTIKTNEVEAADSSDVGANKIK